MSYPYEISYCPHRTNIAFSNVQFSDFSNVQYFQQSESEEEVELEEGHEGKCFPYFTRVTIL